MANVSTVNVICRMSAGYVARELGDAMTECWAEGCLSLAREPERFDPVESCRMNPELLKGWLI